MTPPLLEKIKPLVDHEEFPEFSYTLQIGNESWFISKGQILDEAPEGSKEDCIISIDPMAALALAKNPGSAMNLFFQRKIMFSDFSKGTKIALFLNKHLK
jgi:hypothetical protein